MEGVISSTHLYLDAVSQSEVLPAQANPSYFYVDIALGQSIDVVFSSQYDALVMVKKNSLPTEDAFDVKGKSVPVMNEANSVDLNAFRMLRVEGSKATVFDTERVFIGVKNLVNQDNFFRIRVKVVAPERTENETIFIVVGIALLGVTLVLFAALLVYERILKQKAKFTPLEEEKEETIEESPNVEGASTVV